MKTEGKKLLTDIQADRNREEALIRFQRLTGAAFTSYASIRLSMNLFTMYEMSEDISLDRREEIEGYIDVINMALRSIYIDQKLSDELDVVSDIRGSIIDRMKILTFYTDAFELYEYILNRREPEILGTTEEAIDIDQLSDNMFDFVFSEDDKMLINTRIKDFTAQLPVRMTRDHFYGIISSSINIYKGSEKKYVSEYIASIRDAALLDTPDGYQETYPELYKIYEKLKGADYSNLSRAEYDELEECISQASSIISESVTDYLMLTEIINDVLILLYVFNTTDRSYLGEHYDVASHIIREIITADDIYEAAKSFDDLFIRLEGMQEQYFEELSFLAGNLDDLKATYYDFYDSDSIRDNFDRLQKADILTSSSLFMDIEDDEITVVVDEADEIFIKEESDELIEALKDRLKSLDKYMRRAIMAKILAQMPVFFNTKDEIREYFKYALSSCTDKAELTACRALIEDLMI